MAKCAHEKAVELVSGIVKSDAAAIFEQDLFIANIIDLSRLKTSSDGPLHSACYFIIFMLHHIVRDRWMVRSLLNKDHGAVLASSLVSFTQDRVQRLLEALIVDRDAHVCGNHHFHSFNGIVCQLCRLSEVSWQCAEMLSDHIESCLVGHASDWEADSSQIKLAV